jgi:cytochrome P450
VVGSDEYLSAPEANKVFLGQSMGNVIATMTGAQHRLNRAVVANVFFPKKMRELADTMFAEEAVLQAETLAGRGEVDLVADYTRRYTFNNITRLLGLPREDVAVLEDWADRIMYSFVDMDAAISAGREMGEYLLPIVAQRRNNSTGDVISLLLEATVDGESLSDDEVLAFCRNLFPAAIDTSTNSLGSSLYQLLQRRDLLLLLEDENERKVNSVIDEMLRLETPLVMIPRRCIKQIELGGYMINVGDDTRICITGANTDPDEFKNPHEFNADRKNKDMTFGHGEHFCLGTHMARRVLETGLTTLLKRFPEMALCEDRTVEIIGGVLRGPKALWVRPNA